MKNPKKILIHLLVWIGYFNLIAWSFSSFDQWEESIVRALVIVAIHAFLFYLNADVLMPRFLDKGRVVLYALLILASMSTVLVLLEGPVKRVLPSREQVFERPLEPAVRRAPKWPKRFKPQLRPKGMRDPRAIGIIISSAVALFVSSIYFNLRNKKSKDEELLQLKNQSLEAEKKFLKSQINPHFLFNTLNNLYSLAMAKSDKTADAIQQLSELLRYSIYDAEHKLVALNKELDYIQHYIQLQTLKDDSFASKIRFSPTPVDGDYYIPPMILLPMIENAFKHGNLASSDDAFLAIDVRTANNKVHFSCKNSVSKDMQIKDHTPGIGLKNVKRRLEIFFGEAFELQIKKEDATFSVNLELTIGNEIYLLNY